MRFNNFVIYITCFQDLLLGIIICFYDFFFNFMRHLSGSCYTNCRICYYTIQITIPGKHENDPKEVDEILNITDLSNLIRRSSSLRI